MSGLVLIAERDPFTLRLLEELCDEAGFDVVVAGDAETALNVIARQRPALIVLDALLRTDDGADVLEVLQSDSSLASLPVLLTIVEGDEETLRRGLELGASDYVSRPFRVFEVEQRIRNLLRLSLAEQAVSRGRSSLSSDPSDLGVDELTHVGGAGQLRITAEYEATRSIRFQHPLAVIALRIDNLDEIVQASGEETGQGLLVQLANNLRTTIRGIDHLFRADTDEFVILLPETAPDDVGTVVARLLAEARAGRLAGTAIRPAPRLLIGHAAFTASSLSDGETLLVEARAALEPAG